MKFESARSLKEEMVERFADVPTRRPAGFAQRLVAPATNLITAPTKAFAFAASAVGANPVLDFFGIQHETSIGFGVAVSRTDDYKLAVRYPWLKTSRAPHLEEFRKIAKDEIDVAWTGPVIACARSDEWVREICRPLRIGGSVASQSGTAGTVCAFVRRGGGNPELLSCNHILADCGAALANVAILQPGPSDGGGSAAMIGRLAHFHPLDRDGHNLVDCAVASVATGIEADYAVLHGLGNLAGIIDSLWYGSSEMEAARVHKIGRTTGLTSGQITAVSVRQDITYEGFGSCIFDDLVEVRSEEGFFSKGGDSGSLIVTEQESAGSSQNCLGIGMIVAGTEGGSSYATRLDTVLSQLGADLVT